MPSYSSHSITIFSILFVCLILFSSATPSTSSATNSDEKVSLAFYYESLCPYCANFMINHLAKIFDDGLIDIIELKLIPWGNAKMRSNSTFDCQHGPSECLLNTVEACAINVWPDLSEHFPFIHCVETMVHEHKYPQWETCFDSLGLDPAPITECYSSGYGKELELQYAAETNALQPPHQYVPWVVVNGQPLYDDYENFISYVCKAYNESAVPNACSSFSIKDLLKRKNNIVDVVSHPEKDADLTMLMKIRSVIKLWMLQIIDGAEL